MLVADVFLVSLIDDAGEVIATSTLQEANIEVSVQENEVRGGRSNQLLAILHSDRDIQISLNDSEFRYDWLAKQLGQTISTGAGIAYAQPYEVIASGTTTITATLPADAPTPKATGHQMYVWNATTKAKVTGFTIATKTITFPSGASAGDVLEVRTYIYDSAAGTQTINIDNAVFAKGLKAILETIEIDNDETPKYRLQYQFDETLPSGNFSINTSSERTANAQGFNLRVIKPKGSSVVGRVLRIPIV